MIARDRCSKRWVCWAVYVWCLFCCSSTREFNVLVKCFIFLFCWLLPNRLGDAIFFDEILLKWFGTARASTAAPATAEPIQLYCVYIRENENKWLNERASEFEERHNQMHSHTQTHSCNIVAHLNAYDLYCTLRLKSKVTNGTYNNSTDEKNERASERASKKEICNIVVHTRNEMSLCGIIAIMESVRTRWHTHTHRKTGVK